MDLYLIGVLKQRKSTIGYRLLDLEFKDPSKKVLDIKADTLQRYIKDGRLQVKGLQFDGTQLVGDNGTVDRYTVIKMPSRDAVQPQAAVVLKQVGDSKYRISDFNGNIITVKSEDFINKLETGSLSIANGKVVNRQNGTKFISAIYGQYDQIPDDEAKDTSTETIESMARNQVAMDVNDIESREKKEKLKADREARDARLAEKYNNLVKNADNSAILARSDKILKSREAADNRIIAAELEAGGNCYPVVRFERDTEQMIIDIAQDKGLSDAEKAERTKEVNESRDEFYNNITGGVPLTDKQLKTVMDIRHKARIDILDKKAKESLIKDSLGNTTNAVKVPIVRETIVSERISDILQSQITYRQRQGMLNTEELTVTSKLQAAMAACRRGAAYYFYVIQSLKLIESKDIPTMAADESAVYYNAQFVNDLDIDCLVFVLIHEACHVLMNHSLRGVGKLHYLYNVACDLYVNKFIVDEFGMNPESGTQVPIIPKQSRSGSSNTMQHEGIVGIKFPAGGEYSPIVDCNKDTPEQIYSKLEDEYKKNLQNMQNSQSGQGQNQSGQGQSGQGQSQGGQGQSQSGQGQNGQGQSGQGQSGQSQSGQSQSQNQSGQGRNKGQGQNDGGQDGNGQNKSKNGQGNEQNQSGQGNGQNLTSQELDALKKTLKEVFGVQVDNIESDLVKNEKNIHDSESDRKSRQKQAAAAAQVRLQKGGVKSYGTGLSEQIQRNIEATLAPVVNWRYALRRLVQSSKTLDYSYQKPKRQYLQQNMIFPQDVPGDPDTIGTVLIAIDTQGSIQDQEIGMALKQIMDLLKKFKQTGIILYWDTKVAAKQQFKTVNDALRLKPAGGGGTDPNCIFEYLDNDKIFKQRVNKHKIEAIIVFTDGCFGEIKEKYCKRYGKKTVWVISNPDIKWKAPMGITAPFKQ